MPPHDNSFGKNDPINLVNRDDGRRNRSGSAAEEDAEMSASSTRPPTLLGNLRVPLPVMMFGLSASANGGAPPPLPPPAPAAMRMEGPVGPLRREEMNAILRDVLAMIDDDDFADMDEPGTTQGAPSSRGEGGSRRYNSHHDHNPAQ